MNKGIGDGGTGREIKMRKNPLKRRIKDERQNGRQKKINKGNIVNGQVFKQVIGDISVRN